MGGGGKILYRPFCYCYLVDPGSSHTLVLKIKPYISKCFVFLKFDCGQLIITVIELLRILYRTCGNSGAIFGRLQMGSILKLERL